MRDSAKLAFGFLGTLPTGLKGEFPSKSHHVSLPNIPWRWALGLVDSALAWPPLDNDAAVQQQLVALIEKTFSAKDRWLEYLCVHQLREGHWLRTPERRQLYRRMLLRDDADPELLNIGASTFRRYPPDKRCEAFRWLLGRTPWDGGQNLADRLGQYCGYFAMGVTAHGRDPLAQLVDEVLNDPKAFSFLRVVDSGNAFLKGLAFGIKERVVPDPAKHLPATADYGRWMLTIWKKLRSLSGSASDTSRIVVFAVSWIEQSAEGPLLDLKPWGKAVLPLLEGVAADGGRADCHAVFHHFGSIRAISVTSANDLLKVITIWTQRIAALVAANGEDLLARDPARGEYYPWRECASQAAQIVRALHSAGALSSAVDLDRAYQLVRVLAEPPVSSLNAVEVLRAIRGAD